MADVNRGSRPLPHLTIYRPQLTSMTSILTRITGNALAVRRHMLVVWWFLAAASYGADYFAIAAGALLTSAGLVIIVLFLSLSVLRLWYHFAAPASGT